MSGGVVIVTTSLMTTLRIAVCREFRVTALSRCLKWKREGCIASTPIGDMTPAYTGTHAPPVRHEHGDGPPRASLQLLNMRHCTSTMYLVQLCELVLVHREINLQWK